MITTQNASLNTVQITIQALSVSGKQMTLAVFRQLPIGVESAASDVWGVVRYQIKDGGDLWLVFSADGILYRRSIEVRTEDQLLAPVQNAERRCADARKKLFTNFNISTLEGRQSDADKALKALADAEAAYKQNVIHNGNELRASQLKQLFIAL